MAQRSDADLLARVAAGEERALRGLVERHSTWLLLRLKRRTPDEELAASALQDTFVAVWRNAKGYRAAHWLALPGSPQLWVLYRLALCTLGYWSIYHDLQPNRGTLRKLSWGCWARSV